MVVHKQASYLCSLFHMNDKFCRRGLISKPVCLIGSCNKQKPRFLKGGTPLAILLTDLWIWQYESIKSIV